RRDRQRRPRSAATLGVCVAGAGAETAPWTASYPQMTGNRLEGWDMSKIKLAMGACALAAALTAFASAASSPLALGPTAMGHVTQYLGYYDGHKDTFVLTDVSNKAQAKALHVNYSAAIKNAKAAPPQYFIMGPAAKGQLSVFGSEPGESD